jgi:hypothetical protein
MVPFVKPHVLNVRIVEQDERHVGLRQKRLHQNRRFIATIIGIRYRNRQSFTVAANGPYVHIRPALVRTMRRHSATLLKTYIANADFNPCGRKSLATVRID